MNLKKDAKKYFFSQKSPDFLFELYFNFARMKGNRQLSYILEHKKDLMESLRPIEKEHWETRIQNVLECPDNKDIPRVREAGNLSDDGLVMHNGIIIDPLSYYSFPILKMLMENGGIHEPQEEKCFQEVLKKMTTRGTKTMIELGSYWSFYSLWFLQAFPDANCTMVEPLKKNLFFGKQNFRINKRKGTFVHAGIGKAVDKKNNITTVDAICKDHQIDFIDLLHSDIQGFELDMLQGARRMLCEKKVGYIFISTHSNPLHQDCRMFLEKEFGFSTLASADLDETYSFDGILVMKSPGYPGVEKLSISKKEKVLQ